MTFQVFQDLRFRGQFLKNVKKFPCFRVFYDLKQSNRHKLWWLPKSMPFALFNNSSLYYIVLSLSSAVTNFSNKTLILHDLRGPAIKFHDFPGLEIEIFLKIP